MVIDKLIWQMTVKLERMRLQSQAFLSLKSLVWTRHVVLGKVPKLSESSFLICKIGLRARIGVR